MDSTIYTIKAFDTKSIRDMREHAYTGVRPMPPNATRCQDMDAVDWYFTVAELYPELNGARSDADLVERLDAVRSRFDMIADSGAMTKLEFNTYSGARDNTQQLIDILRR